MLAERNEAFKTQPISWGKITPLIEKQWIRVDELVNQDKLLSGGDFYIASQLAEDPSGWFEQRQKQHELAISALLLDEPNAPRLVAHTWDQLMLSIGRKQRFGTILSWDLATGTPGPPDLDASAVTGLKALLMDPASARKTVAGVADNKELQDIRTADQAARSFDFSKATEQQLRDMSKGDVQRYARTLEIVRTGGAKTAKDFEAAALVFQHGNGIESYQLAHELSLVSIALGTKDAAWLVSRSYDRMLLNLGHRQRYGTNANMAGLSPVSEWMNDRMRKLGVVKSLVDQRRWGDSIKQGSGR